MERRHSAELRSSQEHIMQQLLSSLDQELTEKYVSGYDQVRLPKRIAQWFMKHNRSQDAQRYQAKSERSFHAIDSAYPLYGSAESVLKEPLMPNYSREKNIEGFQEQVEAAIQAHNHSAIIDLYAQRNYRDPKSTCYALVKHVHDMPWIIPHLIEYIQSTEEDIGTEVLFLYADLAQALQHTSEYNATFRACYDKAKQQYTELENRTGRAGLLEKLAQISWDVDRVVDSDVQSAFNDLLEAMDIDDDFPDYSHAVMALARVYEYCSEDGKARQRLQVLSDQEDHWHYVEGLGDLALVQAQRDIVAGWRSLQSMLSYIQEKRLRYSDPENESSPSYVSLVVEYLTKMPR